MRIRVLPMIMLLLCTCWAAKAQEVEVYDLESSRAHDLFQRANAALKEGNYVNAVIHFDEATQLYRQLLGDGHKRLAMVYRTVAERLSDAGHVREAIPYCLSAIEVLQAQKDPSLSELGQLYLAAAQLHQHQKMTAAALDFYQKTEEIYLSLPQVRPGFVADLRLVRANLLFEIGHYEKAAALFRKVADMIISETGSELNHNLAVIYGNMGHAYLESDSLELAIDHLRKAVTLNQKLFGQPTEDMAHIYKAISSIFFGQLHLDSAQHYAIKTLQVYDALPDRYDGQVIKFLEHFCKALFRLETYATAAVWYKKYLNRLERSGQLSDDYFMVRCLHVAELFAQRWQFNEAMEFYHRALEFAEQTYGRNDFRVANLALSMAENYGKLQDYGMAQEFYLKALDLQKQQPAPDRTVLLDICIKLGEVFAKGENYQLSNCYYEKGLAYLQGESNKKAGLLHKVATNLYFLKDYDRALAIVSQELAFYKKVYAGEHVNMPSALLLKGNILAAQQKAAEAQPYFQAALSLDKAILDRGTQLAFEACYHLWEWYNLQGQTQEAAKFLEKAHRL